MSEFPKKYPDHLVLYKPEYCQQLIDHLAHGYSFESFGAIVGRGRATLYEWVEKYPEFAEAKRVGSERGLKFLEDALLSTAMKETIKDTVYDRKFDPKKINPWTIQWLLKTRHHQLYSERNHVKIEGGETPIKVEHKVDLSKLSLEELKMLKQMKEKINVGSDN